MLAEKRRRKSRHGDPLDIPTIRLQLLAKTVRANQWLASNVHILKLPYMTRETSKGDLARVVDALPNLRYVDLPDGFYNGDPSCHTLRSELQARCPDLRKMKFEAGSEKSFETLNQRYWQSLEILELSNLRIQPSTLRTIISILPTLHELRLLDLPWLNDTIFQSTPNLYDFPPLHTLILKGTPQVTANGLLTYLSRPETREILSTLSLSTTGVKIPDLHSILWQSPSLKHLSITETISEALPLEPLPALSSFTLTTLHFEITAPETDQDMGLASPADGYYAYLSNSLLANALPSLRKVYVRDPEFPDSLIVAPPALPFADHNGGGQQQQGFNQPLEVFSKGIAEHDWVYSEVLPSSPAHGRRGSLTGGRPLSSYSASRGLGPQWGDMARTSVVVGNGFGGFLAVPSEEGARPTSRSSMKGFSVFGTPEKERGGEESWGGVLQQQGSRNSLSPGSAFTKGHVKKGSRNDLWR